MINSVHDKKIRLILTRAVMSNRSESGAIIPFILIAIIPIIAMIGMSVDLGILLSAQNQQQLLTRHAALAAMSEYIANLNQCGNFPVGSASSTLRNCAADKAVEQAEKVARVSIRVVTPKLMKKSPGSEIADFNYGSFGNSKHGYISLGKYCFDDKINLPVGCLNACNGISPCFIVEPQKTSESINAVRLTTSVQSNPVRHYFMKLLGIESSDFEVSAVATLIPRNDWFGIDLSASIVEDNYLPNGVDLDGNNIIDPGTRSNFAFPLEDQTLAPPPPEKGVDVVCNETALSPDANCVMAPISIIRYGLGNDGRPKRPSQAAWNNMAYQAIIPGPQVPPYVHYRSGYRLRAIDFGLRVDQATSADISILPPAMSTRWMVHFQDVKPAAGGGTSTTRARPEPLFSILSAVNGGMNTLKNRSVEVDTLSIVGFDAEGDEFVTDDGRDFIHCGEKVTSTTDCLKHCRGNSCIRAMIAETPKDVPGSNFSSFFRATDVLNVPQSHPHSFVSKGLFPIPDVYTDLHAALYNGMLTISQTPNYRFAKNSLFLFTDGFGNCLHDTVSDGLGSIEIPKASLPRDIGGTQFWNCASRGRFVVEAINRILDRSNFDPKNSLDPESQFIHHFIKRKISISIALVGAAGGPHYVIKKSRSGSGCMTQSEAIEIPGETLVNVTSDDPAAGGRSYEDLFDSNQVVDHQLLEDLYKQRSAGSPFYDVNRLYELVKATKGLWIPILPQAIDGTNNPINFSKDLHSSCSVDTLADGQVLTEFDIKNASGVIRDRSGQYMVDGKGRLKFDPYGRTPAQQMEDALEQVLTNPFMLGK